MRTAQHLGGSGGAPALGASVAALEGPVARLLHAPAGARHTEAPRSGTDRALSFERGYDAALLERLRTLRSILPAMATEVAIARREGARLRRENAALRSALAGAQTPSGVPAEASGLALQGSR